MPLLLIGLNVSLAFQTVGQANDFYEFLCDIQLYHVLMQEHQKTKRTGIRFSYALIHPSTPRLVLKQGLHATTTMKENHFLICILFFFFSTCKSIMHTCIFHLQNVLKEILNYSNSENNTLDITVVVSTCLFLLLFLQPIFSLDPDTIYLPHWNCDVNCR